MPLRRVSPTLSQYPRMPDAPPVAGKMMSLPLFHQSLRQPGQRRGGEATLLVGLQDNGLRRVDADAALVAVPDTGSA